MPDQTPAQNHTIVGEDGELLQPDTSVNPDAYTDYLATHIHRDPLVFRIRENVRENGCGYLFLSPFIVLGIVIIIDVFWGETLDYGTKALELAVLLSLGVVIYWVTHHDSRP